MIIIIVMELKLKELIKVIRANLLALFLFAYKMVGIFENAEK